MYAIISQFIITTFVLTIIGYYIGYKIDRTGSLKGILACIFAVCAIIGFIVQLLKLERRNDDKKSRS